MVEPIARRIAGHDVELQLYEWPGEDPAIFLAHATGFHARCWDQVVAHLPGRHVYAIDMRGHGLSDKPEPPYDWRSFGLDVVAVVRTLGLHGAVGVGHSKGGHAVTAAAAAVPAAFGALLLVDPVILPPASYEARPAGVGEHFAARRRDRWASPEEMFDRFKDRRPFSLWEPAVLADYCRYGLVPAPDGDGYVLACPPRIEAAIYAGSAGSNIYEAIGRIRVPVRILRARPRGEAPIEADMSASPTAPDLAARFANAEDVPLPDLTHFMPMQAPALVARHVEEMVAKVVAGD
jgi:pimeloyl-ACP methyl ester carboxylesterase